MREPSYLPFLFGGSSHESDKPKGRVFWGKGVEVAHEVSSSTYPTEARTLLVR